jgi:hypothetical protein
MDAGLQERPTQSEEENYGDRMMVTASTMVGENPAMVHNPGSDGRPPIQETGDGEILHSQPAPFSSPEPFSLGHSLKIRLWFTRPNGKI